MARKHIIEDSSFVISLMNPPDPLHNSALTIFNEILRCPNELRIVIPSTVFYETMFVLLKSLEYRAVKNKLMNLIMVDQIINHSITETGVLKMGINAEQLIEAKPDRKIRSNDLMILSVAMSYENSCLLTSDTGIKDYVSVYSGIYCFNEEGDKNDFISMINS